MWYYKEKDENGEFEDIDGVRYSLTECHRVTAPDGKSNAELGYTEFENMDECLTTWELSKVPETDYETKSISETDTPTTFSLRQNVEPVSETKSILDVTDIHELISNESLKKNIIESFNNIRKKLLAMFKKS